MPRYRLEATYEVEAETPLEAMRKIAKFDVGVADRKAMQLSGECQVTDTRMWEYIDGKLERL